MADSSNHRLLHRCACEETMMYRARVGALAVMRTCAEISSLLHTSRHIREDGRPQPLRDAEAILVFGADLWPTGRSPSLQVRVARAAEVYAEGWAPVILCSGKATEGGSEAMAMRGLLLGRGIPASAIIPDDGGVTTRD